MNHSLPRKDGARAKQSNSMLAHASALLAVGVMISGCSVTGGLNVSASGSPIPANKVADPVATQDEISRGYRLVAVDREYVKALGASTVSAGTSSAQGVPAPLKDYVIGPGDVVAVTVWEHPELTNPAGTEAGTEGSLISADGSMFYPYVGNFIASGMSVNQLREYLTKSLSKVINTPQVDVRVVAFRSQRVQVIGRVASPGLVALNDTPKGLIDVINERGGLTTDASRRWLTLIREGQKIRIDLSDVLSAPTLTELLTVRSGDIVEIPDRTEDRVFMLGEVQSQQPVYLQNSRTTLIDALTQAGGLDKLRADDTGILIFRRPTLDDAVPTVFALDMSTPVGLLLAGEFALAPQDVVYVQSTDFAKYNSVINSLLPTISAVFQIDRLTNSR